MGTNNDYSEFDMKLSEWRGYVVRALEDINKEQGLTNEKIDGLEKKIDALDNRLTMVQVKVASIGGAAGIVASVILWLITKV